MNVETRRYWSKHFIKIVWIGTRIRSEIGIGITLLLDDRPDTLLIRPISYRM